MGILNWGGRKFLLNHFFRGGRETIRREGVLDRPIQNLGGVGASPLSIPF